MKQFLLQVELGKTSRNANLLQKRPGSEPLIKGILFAMIVFCVYGPAANAVPSYARQTGMSCSACHYSFPQLNAFGRLFKLNGYTLSTISTIDGTNLKGKNNLKLLSVPPLSAMTQISVSNLKKAIPGTQNTNVELPQQLSLFLSGSITPKLGAFIQLTYDQQGAAIGIDNVDIRYANQTQLISKEFAYGFTINNNPSVEDLWNSTPAWGYPYASSGVAPSPSASTLIDGGLAQQVAGIGTYGLFNNLVYAEFSMYRSAPQGVADPPDATANMIVKGVVPYWRLALQHQWSGYYVELGTLGLSANMYPTGISGSTNRYTDTGFDLQVEHSISNINLILHSRWIHENQMLNASYESGDAGNTKSSLNSFKIDGSIYFDRGLGFTLAYYSTTGSSDMTVYAPAPVTGSQTGKPDSNGYIMQFDCAPWKNVQFSLQYVINNKFNGTKINYDGSGRNASDNNSIYLLTWINF